MFNSIRGQLLAALAVGTAMTAPSFATVYVNKADVISWSSNGPSPLEFTCHSGIWLHWTLQATGSGSNFLRMHIQEKDSSGKWWDLEDTYLPAGGWTTGNVYVYNWTSGMENLRVKLTKDTFTSAITYGVYVSD